MNRSKREVKYDDSGKIELSVPILLGLFVFFLIAGGGLTYLALQLTQPETPAPEAVVFTLAPTHTSTAETTETPAGSPTLTSTPVPTLTPFTYVVKAGDTCDLLGFTFEVEVIEIILLNDLPATCPLQIGQSVIIPHPTFTPTPEVTATPNQATVSACEIQEVIVQEGDTIGLLSDLSGVPPEKILEWNGKSTSLLFAGERLEIPLCLISEVIGVGTVTPSPAPPHPPVELLKPRNGEYFPATTDEVVLQWAAISELQNNEFYRVTIIDITGENNIVLRDEAQENILILPATLQPNDASAHLFVWTVQPVAIIGGDAENPVYREGGPESQPRYFVWEGSGQ